VAGGNCFCEDEAMQGVGDLTDLHRCDARVEEYSSGGTGRLHPQAEANGVLIGRKILLRVQNIPDGPGRRGFGGLFAGCENH